MPSDEPPPAGPSEVSPGIVNDADPLLAPAPVP
jgi:hypothetical protein